MNRMRAFCMLFIALSLATAVEAGHSYYVGPDGDDGNEGTIGRPFKTISKAAAVVEPGDRCYIRGGTYPETVHLTRSGKPGAPIVFSAHSGESVVIDGRMALPSRGWRKGPAGVFTLNVSEEIHQALASNEAVIFVGDTPYVEARWPNMKLRENWQVEKKWAHFDRDQTTHGTVFCEDAAASRLDFNGAMLHLKFTANGFGSVPVTKHTPGRPEIHYEPVDGFGDPDNKTAFKGTGGYRTDFFISGGRSLLDSPEEWFYDRKNRRLSIVMPHGQSPADQGVSVKARGYGLYAERVDHVVIERIDLFAAGLRFGGQEVPGERRAMYTYCDSIRLAECRVLYSSLSRSRVPLGKGVERKARYTSTHPELFVVNSTVEKCEFGWSQDFGLEVKGRGNTLNDCVVHDSSLDGVMNRSGIHLRFDHQGHFETSEANVLSGTTCYNAGGVALYHTGPGPSLIVSNHLFNAGIYSGDISGTYLPYGKSAGGTRLAHNWVHGIRGMGMRCDAEGNDIHVHHNVVWNSVAGCKWQGYGPFFLNNNTVFVNTKQAPFMLAERTNEHERKEAGHDEVAERWDVMNNAAYDLLYRYSSTYKLELQKRGIKLDNFHSYPQHVNDHFTANLSWKQGAPADWFVSTDLETIDLRPKPGSPLIDAGVVVKGVAEEFKGKAPDAGAYEFGGDDWVPGASWLPDGRKVPATMAEATHLSWEMMGRKWVMGQDKSYDEK